MKIFLAAFFGIVLIFVTARMYSFFLQEKQLSADLSEIEARFNKAQYDAATLQAEVKYLANPLNLEKELRGRFNYKKPGEKMIIIVPKESYTSSSPSRNN
jgi:hypothetical protein